jgi:hypothetical protein
MAETATPVPTEPVVGQIEDFLQAAIRQMPPDPAETGREGPGRPRVLPALCLWAGLLVCVLRGFSSQLALWRLLNSGTFWFYPRFALSDQAVYTRLAAAGTAPLERLFEQIGLVLAERLAPFAAQDLAPFATEVVALDESTLDQVARHLPTLREVPPGDRRLLPGKIAGLFDLRRQQWRRVQVIATPTQNEKVAARQMLDGLPAGSLLVADLGYFAFAFFDDLTDRGYWWISRLRAKTSFTVHHVYYQDAQTFDGLIWLGAYRADQAKHAVRLVRFHVGPKEYSYLCNVLDPRRLPLAEIARLYARRWDFELAVKLIKRHLKLHLLWSAKDVVICQQLWAVLIIAQILHALQLEIASRAGVDPFDVSLALLVQYLPQFAYTGQDPVAFFVAEGRRLRLIRPSTRTHIQAPTIPPEKITHPPPDLLLVRTPRYAQRKCGPRPANQPANQAN